MKTALVRIVACVLTALAVSVPAVTPTHAVEKLRLSVVSGGWKARAETFVVFDADKLFELINGAAPEYIDNGLQNGFRQELIRKAGGNADVFVFDFGDSTRARAMFVQKRSGQSDAQTVSGQDSAAACAIAGVGGVTVFAWYSRHYFEVVLTGIAEVDSALGHAAAIVAHYRTKASEQRSRK